MTAAADRLCILAQYDAEGGLPPHVRIHLQRLRPEVGKLVLVSNSPLSVAARETAEEVCDTILTRPNVGWDFAAWRDALAHEDMTSWDEVILTNSSVVGPLWPMGALLDRMGGKEHDFWGMIFSKQFRPHLQSFFLSFSRQVVLSDAWREFWYNVADLEDKRDVIRKYELGFTQHLLRAGFRAGQVIETVRFPKSIQMCRRGPLQRYFRIPFDINHTNRSLDQFEQLIAEGMPYLKASLLWGPDQYRFSSLARVQDIHGVDYPWEELGLNGHD